MDLTAQLLNEEIVRMRCDVEKSRVRLCRRLTRQRKTLASSASEKKKRKAERLLEEIRACKKVDRDSISKFALINQKAFNELNIKGNIPAGERVFYRIATEATLQQRVDEFRKKYADWVCQVPFLLQRLGHQYRSVRSKKALANATIDETGSRKPSKKAGLLRKSASAILNKEFRKSVRYEGFLTKNNIKGSSFQKPQLSSAVISKGQAVIKKMVINGESSREEQREQEASHAGSLPVKTEKETAFHSSSPFFVSEDDKAQKCTCEANKWGDHPSWSAKRRHAERLARLREEFHPKRTVFSED